LILVEKWERFFTIEFTERWAQINQMHALSLTAIHGFFHTASRAAAACFTTYFLPSAAKSNQKEPLEGNALHPTITSI
tara:strand:+ start:243 stop:476 length:234 start_codon:yes stop_codon:yes gene_type:complete